MDPCCGIVEGRREVSRRAAARQAGGERCAARMKDLFGAATRRDCTVPVQVVLLQWVRVDTCTAFAQHSHSTRTAASAPVTFISPPGIRPKIPK